VSATRLDPCVERGMRAQLALRKKRITGSITPPIWIEPGDDIRFELEPVGSLSANFTT
jgi:hypothetical protein